MNNTNKITDFGCGLTLMRDVPHISRALVSLEIIVSCVSCKGKKERKKTIELILIIKYYFTLHILREDCIYNSF